MLKHYGQVNFEELFAIDRCDPVYSESWGISVLNADGSTTDYDVPPGGDSAAAIEHVEAILHLAFRNR